VKATVDTRIDARAVQRTYVGKKCKGRPGKKRKGHARRTKCPPRRIVESLVHDLRVTFGKPASIKGTLTTAAGAPIAGAEVTVLARPAMAGSSYLAEASVRTDGAGAFAYRVPAGPGRTLDFHFRGDDTYRHADDQVNLRVPASATIRASRHAIRNGRRVQFSGKLLGPPYPVKGKVLDLQAYYRNRWRTFATPRSGRTGNWSYAYRFEATRGTVAYKFRIRVRATSDYPYELGYSRPTTVRVKG
jgi:hypothetical protein